MKTFCLSLSSFSQLIALKKRIPTISKALCALLIAQQLMTSCVSSNYSYYQSTKYGESFYRIKDPVYTTKLTETGQTISTVVQYTPPVAGLITGLVLIGPQPSPSSYLVPALFFSLGMGVGYLLNKWFVPQPEERPILSSEIPLWLKDIQTQYASNPSEFPGLKGLNTKMFIVPNSVGAFRASRNSRDSVVVSLVLTDSAQQKTKVLENAQQTFFYLQAFPKSQYLPQIIRNSLPNYSSLNSLGDLAKTLKPVPNVALIVKEEIINRAKTLEELIALGEQYPEASKIAEKRATTMLSNIEDCNTFIKAFPASQFSSFVLDKRDLYVSAGSESQFEQCIWSSDYKKFLELYETNRHVSQSLIQQARQKYALLSAEEAEIWKNTKNYRVEAETLTDIIINEGDRVIITAEGTMTLGSFAGTHGPEGWTNPSTPEEVAQSVQKFEKPKLLDFGSGLNFAQQGIGMALGVLFGTNTKNTYVTGFPNGTLLARIGDGDYFATGKKIQFVARNSGRLSFLVNDKDDCNNDGGFNVEVAGFSSIEGNVATKTLAQIHDACEKARLARERAEYNTEKSSSGWEEVERKINSQYNYSDGSETSLTIFLRGKDLNNNYTSSITANIKVRYYDSRKYEVSVYPGLSTAFREKSLNFTISESFGGWQPTNVSPTQYFNVLSSFCNSKNISTESVINIASKIFVDSILRD